MDSQGSWEGATVYGNLLTCWIFSSSKEVIFNWHTVVSLIFSFESIRSPSYKTALALTPAGARFFYDKVEARKQKTGSGFLNNLSAWRWITKKRVETDGEERNLEKHGPRLQHQEKLLRDGRSGQFLFHTSTRIHEFFGVIPPPALPDITDPSWELVWLRLLSALTGPVSLGTHQTQVNINIRLSRNRKQKSF